jgi:hypothetical protein
VGDKEFDWNADKMKQLHQNSWRSLDTLTEPVVADWLLNDTRVLKTTINVTNEGYTLNVFITKRIDDWFIEPLWIDVER